jgi:hypothetical protein
MGITLFPW